MLITAAPVDRRRSFPKWCEKQADFTLVGGDADNAGEALAGDLVEAGAHAVELQFPHGVQDLVTFHQATFLMLS